MNLNKLLEPISSENPTGRNVRDDEALQTIYYQLKDTRQNARDTEKKYTQHESADSGLIIWEAVYQQAVDILINHSKDLEVIVWLLEALLRIEGYSGLAAGFSLATKIIEQYWDELYPTEDEEGIESKITAFIGLNGEDAPGSLILPLKSVCITNADTKGPFALWQYQQALQFEKIVDVQKRDQTIREIGFNLNEIQQAVKESKPEFYKALLDSLNQCEICFNKLDNAFIKKCSHEAPPTSYIKNTLNEIKEHIHFLLQDAPFKQKVLKYKDPGEDEGKINPHEEVFSNEGLRAISSQNEVVINSRLEAIEILISISNYFSSSEPHSPIPFLINRAVRWSSMPLPELFNELIQEENARNEVCKLTGVD